MNKEAVLNNIQLAQQGDETAKELIVKNNLGLVWSIVHRFKSNAILGMMGQSRFLVHSRN